ncbi:cytoplasmic formate dehydrogenase-associated NADPH oxidoreductase, ferredoxin-like subunit [Syntrophotalea carbinolica DSM 2380]|uniref:Cytoplasmic formate dehydrogenase-associated NADPH oxidoreductase, ferredoxin-like subunit n=1 Tax=Syntrophotalea carbinolica (strain DSM 2380 / NBRC 103641 / GraBd1) TaxID=338963 RepID=Q3A3H0_SYNC1|nr:NAD(P)H-dependent oxidoreductase subunit E [Syntrophotalea carbinolica]ABA89087.1 cytoplasmic formate dehydrogenase-associated NADPH oxidoreductase, ferredoxin-like subunit [Syntrophotalea carbinolica DSM 2380]
MSSCQETQKCGSPQDLPEYLFRELDDFIEALPTKEGHLITALHKAQSLFGYLPEEIQEYVANAMNVPVVQVFGVVSFYTFFTMIPKGKHPISVCMGTACFVKGADKVVDAFKNQLNVAVSEVTEDGKFSIDCLRCVGACALAPVVLVGEKVYANVTPDQVKDIIAEFA